MDAANVDAAPPQHPATQAALAAAAELLTAARRVVTEASRGDQDYQVLATAMQTILLAYSRSRDDRTISGETMCFAMASALGWSLHHQPEETRFMAGMETLTRALDLAAASSEAERRAPAHGRA